MTKLTFAGQALKNRIFAQTISSFAKWNTYDRWIYTVESLLCLLAFLSTLLSFFFGVSVFPTDAYCPSINDALFLLLSEPSFDSSESLASDA